MMKQYSFTILFLLGILSNIQSQITTGGNIGISTVNNVFIIDFAPEISYACTDEINVGISPFVLYTKDLETNFSNTFFGSRFFSEYTFDLGIFAHAEYEISSGFSSEGLKKVIQSAPIGVGYEQELGSNTVAYAMMLYDILYETDRSLKKNPIIRAGIRYKF